MSPMPPNQTDPTREATVSVPSHLARRIRLALDHAHRDALRNEDGYHRLAEELIECDGYPLEKEPWS